MTSPEAPHLYRCFNTDTNGNLKDSSIYYGPNNPAYCAALPTYFDLLDLEIVTGFTGTDLLEIMRRYACPPNLGLTRQQFIEAVFDEIFDRYRDPTPYLTDKGRLYYDFLLQSGATPAQLAAISGGSARN